MYKMVVFDIDGTLVKYKEHTLKKSTLNAIKKLQKNGIIVVLASGRDHISIGNVFHETQANYFIGANGGFISQLNNNQIQTLLINKINISSFEKYYNDVLKKNYSDIDNIILSDSQNVYVSNFDQLNNHWFWKDYKDRFKSFYDQRNEIIKDDFCLITINCKDDTLINISNNYFNKNKIDLSVQASWKNGFFVSNNDINKATTILNLANNLNISSEEIVAFGDGTNDIEMIKVAGLGVAMGNAVDLLKEVANDIADSVENEGIVSYLKKIKLI
ncbi:MAG: YcsE-related riboflavin metabolism phosphatase [Metamycoplasmataceae bacterium]